MATSFAQVQARVRGHLFGFTRDQEQQASLSASMTAADTTFTVNTSTVQQISRGLIEIDSELILAQQVDQSTGIVTVLGGVNGRGREGTTAASHSSGAIITSSPSYPNQRIKEAINDTLLGIYPNLVVFGSTNITKLAPQLEYELPSDALDVWYVTNQLVGPSKVWQPAVNWRFNPQADTAYFSSGKSIQLLDGVVPGRQQRVVYVKAIGTLTNDSDDFSITGLPERCVDLVTYGAVSRMIPSVESARLQQRTIESNVRSQVVPAQSAVRTAQYFTLMYQTRLAEERNRMFQENPNFQRYEGS